MQMLLKTQTGEEEVASDDVSYSYYINAWGRICRILGKEFARYLPMVMGPVVKAAEQKAEISVVDEDDIEEQQEDGDWSFINITGDKQNVGIKTAGLDEKADALDILRIYAQELKEEFVQYVEPVMKLMVDSLNFFVHEGTYLWARISLKVGESRKGMQLAKRFSDCEFVGTGISNAQFV